MHWFAVFMIGLLYAFIGSLIGVTYALLTGADMSSFGNVVSYGVVLGPVVLVMIAGMRRLARDTGFNIPITRVMYHTLLITFAAPVLLYAAQRIAVAASAPEVARLFEVMKYWSIPAVFITAVIHGIQRVVEGNRPRVASTSGSSGGAPPSGGGSTTSGQPHQQAVSDSLPRDEHGNMMVACFSSRGTPFRLVRRST